MDATSMLNWTDTGVEVDDDIFTHPMGKRMIFKHQVDTLDWIYCNSMGMKEINGWQSIQNNTIITAVSNEYPFINSSNKEIKVIKVMAAGRDEYWNKSIVFAWIPKDFLFKL